MTSVYVKLVIVGSREISSVPTKHIVEVAKRVIEKGAEDGETYNYAQGFMDKYNAIAGAAVAILTAVFGIYWYVFAAFLLLNVIDWLTGWYKSHKKKEESSKTGLIGIVKKLGDHSCGFHYFRRVRTLRKRRAGNQSGILDNDRMVGGCNADRE